MLVNAKSEATATAKKAYQALQDNHCDYGANCDIACLPVAGASCAQPPSMTSGNNFVCSAGIAL